MRLECGILLLTACSHLFLDITLNVRCYHSRMNHQLVYRYTPKNDLLYPFILPLLHKRQQFENMNSLLRCNKLWLTVENHFVHHKVLQPVTRNTRTINVKRSNAQLVTKSNAWCMIRHFRSQTLAQRAKSKY